VNEWVVWSNPSSGRHNCQLSCTNVEGVPFQRLFSYHIPISSSFCSTCRPVTGKHEWEEKVGFSIKVCPSMPSTKIKMWHNTTQLLWQTTTPLLFHDNNTCDVGSSCTTQINSTKTHSSVLFSSLVCQHVRLHHTLSLSHVTFWASEGSSVPQLYAPWGKNHAVCSS